MWAVITEQGIIGEYDTKEEAKRIYNQEVEEARHFNENDPWVSETEFIVLCKMKKKTIIEEEGIVETCY